MTETIVIRLRRPKAELAARAKPNINAWVNDLIDQALEGGDADWPGHFERRKNRKPVRYISDAMRKAER